MNAYGYDYIHTMLVMSVVYCHISVGFLLFYLFYWAMRRPQLVNKQLEVCAFLCLYIQQIILTF